MSAAKPWHKKTPIVAGLVLLAIVILLLAITRDKNTPGHASATQPQPTDIATEEQISQTAPYEGPTDSAANDEQDESKVDFSRLKEFIKKIQDRPIDTAALDSEINQIISNNKDITFGISIQYLNTGQVHNYGVTEAMTAASVTKVLTAVDYYKQVELGHKKLDTVMSNGQTAQRNIEQMIVVSSNDAWHTLNEDLTYQQLHRFKEVNTTLRCTLNSALLCLTVNLIESAPTRPML